MVNVYFNCNLADPWLELAQSVPDVHVAYWIAFKRDPGLKRLKNELSKNTYLHYWEDAWHGNGYPDNLELEPLNQYILDKYAPYELRALQMMDRLDPDRHQFSYLERRRFFRHLLSVAFAVLTKYKIDLVISPSVPHRIHDYVLYAVCKNEGIPFIMFQYVPFKSRSYIIDNIDSIPNIIREYKSNLKSHNTHLEPDLQQKLNELSIAKEYIAPDYMIKQNLTKSKNGGFIGKLKQLRLLKNKLFSASHKPAKTKVRESSIRTQYFSNRVNTRLYVMREFSFKQLSKSYREWMKERPLRGRPYVLVALHYQPEETTSPSAGIYADQTLIVETLIDALDPSIDIVVKEHKSQFNNFGPFKGERGRLPEDYRHLAGISERIRFISVEEDPFKLINNALAIATATGMIGYESALRGTPALIFGRAWFEGMPRVHRITSAKALKERWSVILTEKSADLTSSITSYHKNLQNFLIFASHYRETNSKPLVNTEVSVKNIIVGLANFGNSSENETIREVLSPFIEAAKLRSDNE